MRYPLQEKQTPFASKIKAYDKIVKEVSFQIASLLVQAEEQPEKSKKSIKGIINLLNQAMKTGQAMVVGEDKLINNEEIGNIEVGYIADEEPEESDRDRKDRLFGGHSELTKLSRGIVEEEELEEDKEKKKTPCDKVVGNPYHNAQTGQWAKTKNGKPVEDFVYSKYFNPKCKARAKGEANTRNRKAIPNVKDCGRGRKKDGHGQYRCRDNYRIWEEQEMDVLREHFQRYL